MSKKWAGNTESGKQGFQKTQPKLVSPAGEKKGLFSRLFNTSKPASGEEENASSYDYLKALDQQYALMRQGLGDDIRCYACGRKRKLYKLMRVDNDRVICQYCSRGGEGDNFIKSGEWLAPSPQEIREAKKADKGKK